VQVHYYYLFIMVVQFAKRQNTFQYNYLLYIDVYRLVYSDHNAPNDDTHTL